MKPAAYLCIPCTRSYAEKPKGCVCPTCGAKVEMLGGKPGKKLKASSTDLPTLMKIHGLPTPVPEHRFAPPRRWKFDWAYPELRIAIEREGATWTGGRHTSGSGYEKDAEKYNAAAMLGWCVLRFTVSMIRDGRAIETIKAALKGRVA